MSVEVKSCRNCKWAFLVEDPSVGISLTLDECQSPDLTDEIWAKKEAQMDASKNDEQYFAPCECYQPQLLKECPECHKEVNKPVSECFVGKGWYDELVCSEECQKSTEEQYFKEIEELKEEVEAGFPNVNEHGEYYHRIIKKEEV